MEKTFDFTSNEYYGRAIPYLQEITDGHDIDDSIFYGIESDKNLKKGFGRPIFTREYLEIKTPEEFLGIRRTNDSKFNVKIETYDKELLNNLEKISKGEKIN
ncbi:hypothetical protein COU58_01160 [Candidatus Pacearchaeota archaeon CG10_big_fil_rev_8_21_14_0_10_32_42]|nr:MAG: hypothetical protein COU58_01160 [Candidatus Pacearchaeota archaeon CG10_big_fil_rev_8_21_14_0_10_32_42]